MQFDTFQKFGRDGMDAALRSFGAVSSGAQSAAIEAADFAKRSYEQSAQAAQQLMSARTIDAAVQIQGEFVRGSLETLVAQAAKMGQLAGDTARSAFAPVEALVAKPQGV